MRAPSVLLLVLLLPGCSAPGGIGDDPATAPTQGGLPAPRFQAAMDLSSGRGGGPEPVLAVADDGTIYVAAQDAAGGPPRVWTSQDGGATFRLSRPSASGGGEVDVAAGPRGSVYVTQLSPSGNIVSVSRDRAQTWTQSTFPGTNYFERELVAADERSVYLAARFGLAGITGASANENEASIARSDDGGVTFLPAGRAWDATHEPGLGIGNLVAQPGRLSLAYTCRDATAVCFATSTDRGVTWTQKLVASRGVDTANVYPALAMVGDRALVTWSDAADGRLRVHAASSGDAGASWGPAVQVSAPEETATLPWVAANAGSAWIAYLSTDAPMRSADSAEATGARWSVVATRVDAGSLAVLERGPAHPEPVHEGVMSKPVGQGGGAFDRSMGDFFTTAMSREGKLLLAFPQTMGGRSDVLLVKGL